MEWSTQTANRDEMPCSSKRQACRKTADSRSNNCDLQGSWSISKASVDHVDCHRLGVCDLYGLRARRCSPCCPDWRLSIAHVLSQSGLGFRQAAAHSCGRKLMPWLTPSERYIADHGFRDPLNSYSEYLARLLGHRKANRPFARQ